VSQLGKLESARAPASNKLSPRQTKMRNEPISQPNPDKIRPDDPLAKRTQSRSNPNKMKPHAPLTKRTQPTAERGSIPAPDPRPPAPGPLLLVLASQSPRRAEILRQAGIPFIVRSAPVDETPLPGERPEDYVQRLAEAKAMAVPATPEETVLGADTTVVVEGEMLAKPLDHADARRMLAALAGRRHHVLTGICLRRAAHIVRDCASTAVWFAPMSSAEIEEYVASGEPMDKAGAYAIQGLASKFIERIDGCYFNVVGLPVALVYPLLRGLRPHQSG
jgi:septum formation protein